MDNRKLEELNSNSASSHYQSQAFKFYENDQSLINDFESLNKVEESEITDIMKKQKPYFE